MSKYFCKTLGIMRIKRSAVKVCLAADGQV